MQISKCNPGRNNDFHGLPLGKVPPGEPGGGVASGVLDVMDIAAVDFAAIAAQGGEARRVVARLIGAVIDLVAAIILIGRREISLRRHASSLLARNPIVALGDVVFGVEFGGGDRQGKLVGKAGNAVDVVGAIGHLVWASFARFQPGPSPRLMSFYNPPILERQQKNRTV